MARNIPKETSSPQTTGPDMHASPPQEVQRPVPMDHVVSQLDTLLYELEDVAAVESAPSQAGVDTPDNQLAQVRLGTASSLFAALRCKHAAAAGHALRVALNCSAWALRTGLKAAQRDAVEVAALLHDVGVIGVPDHVLLKPGELTSDEAALMARARQMSLEILRGSCASQEILDIVEHVGAWYDGSREAFRLNQRQIPLGARMIAIAEAFDAMITDQVYRSAMSHERAMAELFDCAGTQFDPELVRSFAELHEGDQSQLHQDVAQRWLSSVDPAMVESYWQLNYVASPRGEVGVDSLFQAKLLENMYDAVVFVDGGSQVTLWNRGAERLTGIAGSSVAQRQWQPELLRMADEKGQPVADADCPVNCAIRSGVQSLRRLSIRGRTGEPVSVDVHAMPVIDETGCTLGAILLFHDASSEISLEERCQSLHEKATKDPLTQVANRAEFDRVHEMFVAAHQQQQVPCSLIIGDLDKFKLVNDTYGHQAGDDVIKSLATLLKGSCRPGDLVARYGGEEFVMLCADCDNAAAARRADQIRRAMSQMPQSKMDGRTATVSFGVTEVQPGDTAETMLRRADRALLTAKSQGRNRTVQLGTGSARQEPKPSWSLFSRKSVEPAHLIQQTFVTPVPEKIAIEKLRGFVADHQAKIINIDGNKVCLEMSGQPRGELRRRADRPVVFCVDMRLEEDRLEKSARSHSSTTLRTKIHLSISLRRDRDRRRNNVLDQARELVVSFRSYLMATEEETSDESTTVGETKRTWKSWLAKKAK